MWIVEERRALGAEQAVALLAREGLAGTSAELLADAMMKSVGGLYRDYGSKVGVARAIVDQGDALLAYALEYAALPPDDADQRTSRDLLRFILRGVWDGALEFSRVREDFFVYGHLHWRHPLGDESGVDRGETQTGSFLDELLGAGMAVGLLRQMPLPLARAFF